MKTFKKYIRDNETALVTGASSGMGLEYAKQLAQSGCNLLIVSNEEEKLKTVAEQIRNDYKVNVVWKYQDLSLPTAAQEVFDFCKDKNIQIDILINNAGIFFFKELNDSTLAKANTMLQLHVYTPTQLCTLFGGEMKKRGRGYILTMSSMAALLPMPGITIYAATKAYLKSFMKSLYYEMRPYGVHTTVICPGAVNTPLYNLSSRFDGAMRVAVKVRFVYSPQLLVHKALRAMFHKRRSKTPGPLNLIWPPIVNAIPKFIVNKLWVKYRS
ncbi:MAG: SDR family NAD(P)-dependent oxidoreductase [Bacteroidales bacterium]|nr:SDR family NAD(P)-dependent oxidoreductase [Bacteroidales bacterium]